METSAELEAVLEALANPKHKWRTAKGVAKEVGLSPEKVIEIFSANRNRIVRSAKPKGDGSDLYISRERLREVSPPLSSQAMIAVKEIAAEISDAEPGDIQRIGSLVIELLNQYNQEVLSQAKTSFRWAVVAAAIGFAVFIGSVVAILSFGKPEIATIGTIGGAIIEVVGGLQFYLYGKTMGQLAYFQQSLDRTQRFLIANSICESLDSDNKQKSRAELVRLIALSVQQGATEPSK
jgi:hypothetical protein